MEIQQEIFRVSVETITPVHVGSGRKLMANSEFIIRPVRDKHTGDVIKKIGIIDEEKILNIIGSDRIDEWIRVIEKNADLIDLLKDAKSDVGIKDFSLRTILLQKKEQGSENFLKEQIFTANRPLIPGSSLKGSIRTAILNDILEKRETPFPDSTFTDRKGKLTDENIQHDIFGKDPNNDIFRFIQIGDIHFTKSSTVALNLLNLNIKQRGAEHDSSKSVLTECIPANEKAICRIKLALNHAGMARIKAGIDRNQLVPENLLQLFKIINTHTLNLVDQELDLWEELSGNSDVDSFIKEMEWLKSNINELTEKSCILRLGHGSGWRFMTGAWPESEKLVSEEMQGKIIDAARPRNHQYSEYIFPKSRRMDEQGELLGFIKLSIED